MLVFGSLHCVLDDERFRRLFKTYFSHDSKRMVLLRVIRKILDAVVEVTGLHRKSAIRRFKKLQMRDGALPEKRGRPTYYTKDVDAALYTVWEAANQPCGELLHPVVKEYVSILKRDGM